MTYETTKLRRERRLVRRAIIAHLEQHVAESAHAAYLDALIDLPGLASDDEPVTLRQAIRSLHERPSWQRV